MLRQTAVSLRKRSPWRELLHPLPKGQRMSTWLRRSKVEQNEEVLRQPYYHLVADGPERRERIAKLRETLVLPSMMGPSVAADAPGAPHVLGRPQPRHPVGWNLVPPTNAQ
jgi:hypothetical protein